MNILPMELEDIAVLAGLTPDGWDDITAHFRYNVLSPFCDPVKVVADGKIVGIGANLMNEDTAWMASIIVLPAYRNMGIGKMIVDTLLSRLDKKKFQTVLLDATEFGYPVYKKVGFEVISQHVHFKGDVQENSPVSPRIIPFEQQHQEGVLALDKIATGENRSAYLLEHMAGAFVYKVDGTVRGAYLPAAVKGMIIAYDPEAGIELMKLRLREKNACLVPIDNTAAIDFLYSVGFKQTHTSPRMRLGVPRAWRADCIYNVISGARG